MLDIFAWIVLIVVIASTIAVFCIAGACCAVAGFSMGNRLAGNVAPSGAAVSGAVTGSRGGSGLIELLPIGLSRVV